MRRKIGVYAVFCVVWACGGLPEAWWEDMTQGSVLYVMDWSVPLEADTAFETASGFEITLTEASLNHWVVQLTPCQASSEPLGFGLNLSTIAWAGHSVGDEALEISQVLGPMSEDLTESAAWVLSTREVDSVRYCYAYWSVASVQVSESEVLPSLRLRGTWRDLNGDESGEIHIDSEINWGIQLSLNSEGDEGVELSGAKTRVTWLRDGRALFDEVDFRLHDEDAIARRVLAALVGSAEIVVERVDSTGGQE